MFTPQKKRFCLVADSGEGDNLSSAFDKALLNAKVGNYNLIKITSIIPPKAIQTNKITLPVGSTLTIAYDSFTSKKQGEVISSVVAIGIPKNKKNQGIIVKTSGFQEKDTLVEQLKKELVESFNNRSLELEQILTKGIEHTVINCGSVFSGVALF
ncbi:pyruvoyl-dependent arginine decarboxylase [Natranaerobius trueperi]|uniref:Pyruvoyl-dependent arginine decarboxylase AaxB n=1 Tax=Natranaerobius trueperi TaxID=759412 RepID=A0A226BUQ5_9FIRM|nr:pyruvoyl-dependent arginine decarboxylase [Natranaerobius trueperi]OWZ82705.1 pyruvoyl-dependent arginine decarboxylase [Natranaerobius trueperi]